MTRATTQRETSTKLWLQPGHAWSVTLTRSEPSPGGGLARSAVIRACLRIHGPTSRRKKAGGKPRIHPLSPWERAGVRVLQAVLVRRE